MIADKLTSYAITALPASAWDAALYLLDSRHGLGHYLRTHYADHTFQNLYRWNIFDAALLIPYFTVMVILSLYGIHRYQLVYRYYKYRKNAVQEPSSFFQELPLITVQLP